LGSSAVLALVLVGGLVGGQWLLPDPKQSVVPVPGKKSRRTAFAELPEVRKAIADLEQKKEVVLVNKTYRAPYWWVFGDETGLKVDSDDGWLTLHSKWVSPSVVEFLPRLPPGKYRIKAIIQHDDGNNFSKVALYVGGWYWESKEGRHFHCIALHYQDVGHEANDPLKPGKTTNSIAPFGTVLTGVIKPRSNHWANEFKAGKVDFLAAGAANRVPAGFRVVEFEVTGSGVEAWLDGKRAGFQSLDPTNKTLQRYWMGYAELNHADPPADPLWGSLGLFVFNGTVHVQELRISPFE
jgi:hypothetical protein